ncbi:flavin reductase family protein [Pseudonocardia sp. NPDC049635]|uniref:flavin reductase family protein n=1 Tax=Pseudonocardia sp. NPDC049635 TaxID=3155506 RepID=UPI0033D2DDBF
MTVPQASDDPIGGAVVSTSDPDSSVSASPLVDLGDQHQVRSAMHRFATGVAAVCGLADGQPRGMVISRFAYVSSAPPIAAICIHAGSPSFPEGSMTWPVLRELPTLGVSILGEQNLDAARSLYRRPEERFSGVSWRADESGAVLICGSILNLQCRIRSSVRIGSHDLVLLDIVEAQEGLDSAPLLFHGDLYRVLDPVRQHSITGGE